MDRGIDWSCGLPPLELDIGLMGIMSDVAVPA
jgi:hypothetical protein